MQRAIMDCAISQQDRAMRKRIAKLGIMGNAHKKAQTTEIAGCLGLRRIFGRQ
jgi:hypothetical protein